MADGFSPPLSKLGQSGIGVAAAPSGGKGIALGDDGYLPPNLVQYGTTFPTGTVANGTEFLYVADVGTGIVWRFRYNAGSSSTYKWEFIGGPPLYSNVETQENTGSTTYVDLATTGPSNICARAGEYLATISADCINDTAADYAVVGFKVGSAATGDELEARSGAGLIDVNCATTRIFTAAAGDTVKMQYRVAVGGTGYFSRRRQQILPVRVA